MFYSIKFKKFKKINHCFFSRNGGFSTGIYQSLNCGRGSKDKNKIINKNLSLVSKKMRIKRDKLILMHQTHSNKVIVINKINKKIKKFKSDAIITKLKGFALGVVTADCVPIILYDKKNQVIGCIHAGWKGVSKRIIENTINQFKKMNSNSQIFAAIGPCIGKKSYEVDLKFYNHFLSLERGNTIYFAKLNKGKKLFDLRKYVEHRLTKIGVVVDHVRHDTFIEKDKFFSFRRSRKLDENDYGRCISVISLI